MIHGVEGLLPNVNFITADLGYERGGYGREYFMPGSQLLVGKKF